MAGRTTTHIAPAGRTYQSIEEAGKEILLQNSDSYPSTNRSSILPAIFVIKFTEAIDLTTGNPVGPLSPTLKTQKVFEGLITNQSGETSEKRVFDKLNNVIATNPAQPILVLHGTKLTKAKLTALTSEFPKIANDMAKFETEFGSDAESDYIILIKDTGAISLEVKREAHPNAVSKVTIQHNRTKAFIAMISKIINPACSLPLAAVSVFTHGTQTSYPTNDEFHFYQDNLEDFQRSWNEVLNNLKRQSTASTLQGSDFKKLADIISGTSFMKTIGRQLSYQDCDMEVVSWKPLLKSIDTTIDEGHLSSNATKQTEAKKNPIDNVYLNPANSVFRQKNKSINLMYLTPEQKHVFDSIWKGIVRGPAGSGKTWLLLLKIKELLDSSTTDKFLLVAPYPHNIRCKLFFDENRINVQETDILNLPVERISESVIIMPGLKFTDKANFPANCHYVLSNKMHLFFDDAHSFDKQIRKCADFKDMCERMHTRLWISHDLQQQVNPTDSFVINTKLPIYELSKVLRNSHQICEASLAVRKEWNSWYNLTDSSSIVPGHNIQADLVHTHQLVTRLKPRNADFKPLYKLFLKKVLKPMLDEFSTNWSDVLIVTDLKVRLEAAQEFLTEEGIPHGEVAEQLVAVKPMLAIDSYQYVQSGEWCVVFCLDAAIGYQAGLQYVPMSRARTELVMLPAAKLSASVAPWMKLHLHRYKLIDNDIQDCTADPGRTAGKCCLV